MTHGISRPPWRLRALALAAFVALAPVVWILPARRRSPFLHRQTAQALVLNLALAAVMLIILLLVFMVSYMLVFQRGVYENRPVERIVIDIQGTLLVLWAVAWCIGALKALRGSDRGIPYFTRLRDSRGAVRFGLAASLALYAIAGTVSVLAINASARAENVLHEAKAYMLYDDIGWVPQWVFELGFYRIARVVDRAWGQGSTVVVPFTHEALEVALGHGVFVFLSSHGTEDGLYTRERWFKPEDVAALDKGEALEYVYITGCDSGTQARAWEHVLAPAEVITFNRLSAVIEHIYWLWFRGPDVVRGLAAQGQ